MPYVMYAHSSHSFPLVLVLSEVTFLCCVCCANHIRVDLFGYCVGHGHCIGCSFGEMCERVCISACMRFLC